MSETDFEAVGNVDGDKYIFSLEIICTHCVRFRVQQNDILLNKESGVSYCY